MNEGTPRVGDELGELRIEAFLEMGPLGPIYRARDAGEREVAVEVLTADEVPDGERRARLEEALESAARLSHRGLVRLERVERGPRGELWLVREPWTGDGLDRLLAEEGPLEPARAVAVLTEVLEALEVVHGAGLVQRDLRPRRLRVDRSGRVKLLGVGLGPALEDEEELLTGPATGRVSYASPEETAGDPLDGRSDLYAVGVLAYELLTGQVPFQARNALELVRKHRQEPPPALASLRPGLPGCLEPVIGRALAKAPEARPRSARELLDELAALPLAGARSRQETATRDEGRGTRPAGGREAFYDELVGSTLDGEYRVLEKLGEGGMGGVFRARSELLGHEVAVKVIHPDKAGQRTARERFLREARAALEFAHPNAIAVRTCRETLEGLLYMTLDLSPGRDLDAVLDEEGRLEVPRALGLVRQALMALAEAHAKGIVHRDLKPQNMLIEEDEQGHELLRVCDFGIAKLLDQTGRSRGEPLTGDWAIGTPYYMAPEQAAGGRVDGRADLYALGCVLYELLLGEPVFDGDPQVVLLAHIGAEPPRSPLSRLPPEVEALVLRALAKSPGDRFADAEAFIAAIDTLGYELPPRSYGRQAARPAPEPQPPAPRRGRLVLAVLAICLLAALLAALLFGWGQIG
jgi:serine/threonine-protein kinase